MPLVDGKLIGKYRKLLIAHDDLPREAETLGQPIYQAAQEYKRGNLSDAGFTDAFIRIFATHRSTIMRNQEIRGMPGMISSILNDWRAGKVLLRLTTQSLTAHDMLAAQAEGWRYVTVDIDAALSGRTVEETRDAFEFALHDLGHAYAFFKAEYDHAGQVKFFTELLSDLPQLSILAGADDKFAHALNYAMSDMNSHPQHLREFVRGVIVESFLRQSRSESELTDFLVSLSSLTGLKSVLHCER